MNYIKQLAGFFDRVVADERLNPTHVSMYVALFQFWNASRFQNPISISRNELMKVSKISAKATYHKCMKELNDFGYLQYRPSYNPFKGSLVYLFDFQTGAEQLADAHRTKNEAGSVQAQEPYINASNSLNQTDQNERTADKKNSQSNSRELVRKEKSSAKKEIIIQPPLLGDVKEYFVEKKYKALEAEKFFTYYTSNGWLVGGKTQMRNWRASADKWMLNEKTFSTGTSQKHKAKNLHADPNKNYSEPL